MDVFFTELGIRLSFVKTSEFGMGPPSVSHFMAQSPWEANQFVASQEVVTLLREKWDIAILAM
jgi:hypothetical protein